jgi:DNA-binding GntR family transcriptional regulator
MENIQIDRVRDRVREAIGEMIVTGDIPSGSHLDEVGVSEQIGVSRTPVREALIALESEGLVQSRPRKGFVVVRAQPELVRESFAILGALESLAIKSSGAALFENIANLRELNEMLSKEEVKARQYELDRAFHAMLTARCSNKRLLSLLAMERARAQLIDGYHGRGIASLEMSVGQHSTIIAAIESGKFDEAAKLAEQHWIDGIGVVIKWFEQKMS